MVRLAPDTVFADGGRKSGSVEGDWPQLDEVTRQTPTTGATIPFDGGLPDATPR
ncbi:MAG: hypothetical protein HQL03_03450 [Nitrospirae bacterium]|nr:hypothetical protein [Nitrospirota bacterium]